MVIVSLFILKLSLRVICVLSVSGRLLPFAKSFDTVLPNRISLLLVVVGQLVDPYFLVAWQAKQTHFTMKVQLQI